MERPVNISYPQEWSDRDRMNFLLSPFPPSTQNISQDNSKFCFWSSLVLSSSRELCSLVVSEKVLQERFKWNDQHYPMCLGLVLEEMEGIGHLVKLTDFYNTDQSSWMWWSVGMLKKPVSWAVKSYLPVTKYKGEYIIKPLAEELAAVVIADHQSSILYKLTDSVMTYSALEELCLKSVSHAMVPVLTQQLLSRGQLAKAQTEHGYEVVKISYTKDKRLTVSEVDIGIVRIKETMPVLSKQVTALEESISRLKQNAKEKCKLKDKPGALHILRQHSCKQSLLQKKMTMLDNAQGILRSIQSADTDAMIFAAYKSGAQALQSILKDSSLEKAEDVMASLREVVEEGEEIGAVLSEGLTSQNDEEELLKELDLLMMDQNPIGKVSSMQSEVEDLEVHMALLSAQDKEVTYALEQLPPVSDHDTMRKKGGPLLAAAEQEKTSPFTNMTKKCHVMCMQ